MKVVRRVAEEEVEIIDFRKVPSTDPERLGKLDVLILYRYAGRIYTLRIPEEKFSEEELMRVLSEEIKKMRMWLGRKLKVKLE